MGAFTAALAAVLVATPIAIAVAERLSLHDHPRGYKAHRAATPYLGGTAVLLGFIAALAFAGDASRFGPLVLGAVILCAVGTLDDRQTVSPVYRILAAAAMAVLLSATGGGWSVFGSETANVVATVVWVVALVNAFNLMDNMDGAAPTVATVSGAGIAVFAFANSDPAMGTMVVGLVGACVAFLKYNLTSPARIFLGDGGSMPIGFIVAGAIMSLPQTGSSALLTLIPAVLLVGLVVFDTTLVIVSRYRRRARIYRGARDHLTHRLLPLLRTPRAVATTLAFVQAALCVLAIAAVELGTTVSAFVAAECMVLAVLAGYVLERDSKVGRPAWANVASTNGHAPDAAALADELLKALEPRRAQSEGSFLSAETRADAVYTRAASTGERPAK